jgi:small subunit ribosomal protein S9
MATAAKTTKKATAEVKVEKPKALPKVQKDNSVEVPKIPSGAFYGTGKRKSAIAKVWLFPGKGAFYVNGKDSKDYFTIPQYHGKLTKPFETIGVLAKYDTVISTYGGGISGQADASLLGISRALLELNAEFRKELKEEGHLTRDPRVKERKKYGRKKARKGFQYRKR